MMVILILIPICIEPPLGIGCALSTLYAIGKDLGQRHNYRREKK